MATAGGLSRRRVPNASGSAMANDEDGASPTTPTGNGGGLSTHSSIHSVSHAGTAFEGGSKIAYDPRDLENADERQDRLGQHGSRRTPVIAAGQTMVRQARTGSSKST